MFVKTNNANQIVQYPYDLELFRNENSNVSLPQSLSNKLLERFYVFPVYEAVKPDHNTITQFVTKQQTPYFEDSSWKIGWDIIDKAPEQIQFEFQNYKAEYQERINEARDNAIHQTVYVDVNETTTVPVDVRKNTADIQNISGLTQAATIQIINNDNTLLSFRGADDVVYTLTPQEIIKLGTTVSKKYSAMYAQSWVMKDQLQATTTINEINSIDISFDVL